MSRLLLYVGERHVGSLTLADRTYFIGRDEDCDLRLRSAAASRRHFRVVPHSGGVYVLEDLKSANGVFINGVREYRMKLEDRCVIQAGDDLIVFEPGEQPAEPRLIESLPAWAVESARPKKSKFAEMQEDPTQLVAPAIQRRAQAEGRARMRPHLVVKLRTGERIFPLEMAVTPIGYGPVKVSIGPAPGGKTQVLAEVVRGNSDDDWSIRAKGLFAKVSVNGQQKARSPLKPGDRFTVGDVTFLFQLGLSSMDVTWTPG